MENTNRPEMPPKDGYQRLVIHISTASDQKIEEIKADHKDIVDSFLDFTTIKKMCKAELFGEMLHIDTSFNDDASMETYAFIYLIKEPGGIPHGTLQSYYNNISGLTWGLDGTEVNAIEFESRNWIALANGGVEEFGTYEPVKSAKGSNIKPKKAGPDNEWVIKCNNEIWPIILT